MRHLGFMVLTVGFAYTGLAVAFEGIGVSHTTDMILLFFYLSIGWMFLVGEYLEGN